MFKSLLEDNETAICWITLRLQSQHVCAFHSPLKDPRLLSWESRLFLFREENARGEKLLPAQSYRQNMECFIPFALSEQGKGLIALRLLKTRATGGSGANENCPTNSKTYTCIKKTILNFNKPSYLPPFSR